MATPPTYSPELIGVAIPVEPYLDVRRHLLLVDELWIPTTRPRTTSQWDYFSLLASWIERIRQHPDIQWLESKGRVRLIEIDESDFRTATFDDKHSFLSWALAVMYCVVLEGIEEKAFELAALQEFFLQQVRPERLGLTVSDVTLTTKDLYWVIAHMMADSASRVAATKQRHQFDREAVALNSAKSQESIEHVVSLIGRNLPLLGPDAFDVQRFQGTVVFQTLKDKLITALPKDSAQRVTRALGQTQLPKTNVAQIVLKQLPVPRDDSPIEEYVDFSDDPDTRVRLARLRFWMRKTASGNRSARDIEQELQELLFEYDQHVKQHNIKTENMVLRTVLTTTADVLDNIVRLKFKPIVESLFALGDRHMQLIESENKAPGREVSYVHAVQSAAL